MAASVTPLFEVAPRTRKPGDMTRHLETTLKARQAQGLIDMDLWGAEIALARDAALEIDNPAPGMKAYARAELCRVLLDVLDRLPRPTSTGESTTDLDRVLAVIAS